MRVIVRINKPIMHSLYPPGVHSQHSFPKSVFMAVMQGAVQSGACQRASVPGVATFRFIPSLSEQSERALPGLGEGVERRDDREGERVRAREGGRGDGDGERVRAREGGRGEGERVRQSGVAGGEG